MRMRGFSYICSIICITMEKSKVYFTNLRTNPKSPLPKKMENLVKAAGIGNIDFKDKFVAIKIHFGEAGNMAYLRPNYAARLVELIRSLGGKPFLTDSNTLYSGSRSNAVDHLDCAMKNGYNPISANANIIIDTKEIIPDHSIILLNLFSLIVVNTIQLNKVNTAHKLSIIPKLTPLRLI